MDAVTAPAEASRPPAGPPSQARPAAADGGGGTMAAADRMSGQGSARAGSGNRAARVPPPK